MQPAKGGMFDSLGDVAKHLQKIGAKLDAPSDPKMAEILNQFGVLNKPKSLYSFIKFTKIGFKCTHVMELLIWPGDDTNCYLRNYIFCCIQIISQNNPQIGMRVKFHYHQNSGGPLEMRINKGLKKYLNKRVSIFICLTVVDIDQSSFRFPPCIML